MLSGAKLGIKVLKQYKLTTILITVFYLLSFGIANANEVKLIINTFPGIEKNRVINKIVLDAGHGGHDPGTHGKSHKEKDLTLKMTLLLGDLITEQYPDIEVFYTRSEDKFIPLHERIGFANKINADLFISIHCNYVRNKKTHGTETFVMGLHRAEENLEVAKRENQSLLLESDVENNYGGFDPNSPVGYIMLSNYQDAYLDQSIDFANKIEGKLKSRAISHSRGVKQAGFAVLRRATMPSVLVETGFLSNANEEKYLGSDEGQLEVCQSIVEAIGQYAQYRGDEVEAQKVGEPTEVVNKIKKPVIVPTKQLIESKKYYVQIAAMKEKSDDFSVQSIESIGEVDVIFDNHFYKYRIGAFADNQIAKEARKKLIKLGFDEAFLVKD